MLSLRSQNRSVFALAKNKKFVKDAPDSPPMNIIHMNNSLKSCTNQVQTLSNHKKELINWNITGMNGNIRLIAVT